MDVYAGMIVGKKNRDGDLDVNITKDRKSSIIRISPSGAIVALRSPRPLSLDQAIEFIAEDELVEVTPVAERIRKMGLDTVQREIQVKRGKQAELS